jgi:tetratricopeptide (TPR) repeat protein
VKLNQYGRAIKDYDKAIKLNPDDAEAYNNRGAAYADLNQYEQAIEDYDKAIKLNPDDAEAYGNRGIAYSKIGRYEESARDLKKAGILFFHFGREDDAVKALSNCFDLRDEIGNDDIVYCGLALYLITLNPDVIIKLRRMRIQDGNLKKILDLSLSKLGNEDISEEIRVLGERERREEMIILLELLKRF